jgi:hypothetical protein
METHKLDKDPVSEKLLSSPYAYEVAEVERELARTPRRSESANRTNSKIWSTVDHERQDHDSQDYVPNSGTFLDSAFFSPEAVLPAAYLLDTSESEEVKPINRVRTPRKIEVEAPPQPSSHWVGLIASVSVGILIAIFLFPVVAFFTRSTLSHVMSGWEDEITNRVGTYEQIHANKSTASQSAELLPYNLAASGWQEWQELQKLREEEVARSRAPSEGVILNTSPSTPLMPFAAVTEPRYSNNVQFKSFSVGTITPEFPESPDGTVTVGPHPFSVVNFLREFTDWNTLASADMTGLADTMLLVTPSRETPARSAFGQNILLKDGRVFFRVLPVAE